MIKNSFRSSPIFSYKRRQICESTYIQFLSTVIIGLAEQRATASGREQNVGPPPVRQLKAKANEKGAGRYSSERMNVSTRTNTEFRSSTGSNDIQTSPDESNQFKLSSPSLGTHQRCNSVADSLESASSTTSNHSAFEVDQPIYPDLPVVNPFIGSLDCFTDLDSEMEASSL